MNLSDIIQRLFDEQKWREQKAQSIGLPSTSSFRDPQTGMLNQTWGPFTGDHLPRTLDQQFQQSKPLLQKNFDFHDQGEDEMTRIFDSLSRGLGQQPTTNFLDYYRQKEMIDKRKDKLNQLFQNYMKQGNGYL